MAITERAVELGAPLEELDEVVPPALCAEQTLELVVRALAGVIDLERRVPRGDRVVDGLPATFGELRHLGVDRDLVGIRLREVEAAGLDIADRDPIVVLRVRDLELTERAEVIRIEIRDCLPR